MNTLKCTAFASALAGALVLLPVSGWGTTFDLYAGTFNLTVPGRAAPVVMWGYSSTGVAGTFTSPGPALTVPVGETTITVVLHNGLAVPTSIVIPNQNGYVHSGPAEHSTITDSQGRTRATSFVKEASAGGTATYTWNSVLPGTYLYYSGSHSALQVQMGLYGMLKKNLAANRAYLDVPGGTAAQEVVWIFGEIDFEVHDAVRDGTFDTAIKSMLHSVPEVYLLNGLPYSIGQFTATANPTFVRMLNACYDERIPVLNGYHLQVVAEDGRLYSYAKVENAVNLPSLKTRDALLVASPAAGTVVRFFDRRQLSR